MMYSVNLVNLVVSPYHRIAIAIAICLVLIVLSYIRHTTYSDTIHIILDSLDEIFEYLPLPLPLPLSRSQNKVKSIVQPVECRSIIHHPLS